MATPALLPLENLDPSNPASTGGKAAALARLRQAGFPVPDGFVIPAEAFTVDGLNESFTSLVAEALSGLASKNAHPALFAVRSSAAAEDAPLASFAGEFESVLDVPAAGVPMAAEEVWRSQFADRVRSYTGAQGLGTEQRMNVLVQAMIPAELSGVLFTADPITGSRLAMSGNAVAGLGDRLVSGEADPAVFRLHRPDGRLVIDRDPAVLAGFTRPARTLFRLAARIEQELGSPQDIEWAVAGGQVYILQARPITTLAPVDPETGAPNDSRLGDYLWTSTNFGEALPDVMTPLTWSMMRIYLESNRLGVETDWLPLGGNIGGRLYMNLSLPATLFRALGFNAARINGLVVEAFGELPDGEEIPLIPYSRMQAFRTFVPHAFRRAWLVARLKKQVPGFIADGPRIETEIRAAIASARSPADLLQLWERRLEPVIRHTMLMLAAGTSDYKNLSRRLRPGLAGLVGDADANALLSGRPGAARLASLGPLIGLSQLAAGRITPAEYRRDYGHRGPSEFELSLPSPSEEDGWLESQMERLGHSGRSVDELLAEKVCGHENAWMRLRQAHPRAASKWDRRLADLHAASHTREAVRSEVVRLLRLLRPYALRTGDLTGIGQAVFFLTLDEVARLLDGDRVVLERIDLRRRTHERLTELPPYPPFIRGRFNPLGWAADPGRPGHIFNASAPAGILEDAPETDTIRGFSGSPGIVIGVVRVLESIECSGELAAGEVLVAHTTNVGWTPLFPRAAAIVTDVGAPLSHAAIVARELGIPAVVGTGTATVRLATGMRVRVDGARGTVTIL